MSRMIDQLTDCDWKMPTGLERGANTLARAIQREASRYPIIVGDDIVEYAYNEQFGRGDFLDIKGLEEYPNLSPPFPSIWIESRSNNFLRPFTVTVNGERKDETVRFPYGTAALFHWREPRVMVDEYHGGKDAMHIRKCYELYPDARWMMNAIPIRQWSKHDIEPMSMFAVAIDGKGKAIGDLIPGIESQDTEVGRRRLRFAMATSLLALTFCHCRNIKLIPHDPEKAVQRQRIRREKRPLLRYHTLSIDGVRKLFEKHGAKEHGFMHAMHFCHGHFKTFTPERPLLGRHVGQFWWGDQVRGTGSEGIVTKDYRAKHITELAKTLPPQPREKMKPTARQFLQAASLAGIANLKTEQP